MNEEPTPLPDIQFKPKTNAMLDALPEYTKDPKNYMKIQRALLETLSCKKTHSDVIDLTKCKTCTNNLLARRALLKQFGFTSPAQYMAWRKTHEFIKKRMPLDMYNRIIR